MKKELAVGFMILFLLFAPLTKAAFAAETKKVCVKDDKTGKETCKNVKVHKKLEGTPVPEKKK